MSCKCRFFVVVKGADQYDICKKNKMKIGLVIKELRIKKGLTQEELAERTELSTRTIQRIENGEVDPRAYSLQMIAKALDVDFSLFVEDNPHTEKTKNDNLIAGLIHLSGLFLIFIPTILLWAFYRKKVPSVYDHFKEVISLQLTIWLILILPGIALHYFFKLNNIMNKAHYLIIAGIVATAIFSIKNTINVINDLPFKHIGIIGFGEKSSKGEKSGN